MQATFDRIGRVTEAIADATRLAAQWNCPIYIIRSPVYARSYNEHSGSVHVVGGKDACLTMFKKMDWMKETDWKLVGVVDEKGAAFLNQMDDLLQQFFKFTMNTDF